MNGDSKVSDAPNSSIEGRKQSVTVKRTAIDFTHTDRTMERTTGHTQSSMTSNQHGLFQDIWFGFHLLFMAVVAVVAFSAVSDSQPTDLFVAGPLAVATVGVFGRNILRHLR